MEGKKKVFGSINSSMNCTSANTCGSTEQHLYNELSLKRAVPAVKLQSVFRGHRCAKYLSRTSLAYTHPHTTHRSCTALPAKTIVEYEQDAATNEQTIDACAASSDARAGRLPRTS